MDWFIVLVILVVVAVIVAVYYFRSNLNDSEENEIDKVIPLDKGQVSIKGSSREAFDISVNDGNGTFIYRVKNGNIVGVKIPDNDKYYEYME
ncbi:hypothetical protein ACO1PF_10190 [Alkalibacterium sp. f15]|uniref:hypothetical protein n=1 Tax=Alkalibacterium sp. f15 TaxID=3414029 RepID=UPI003BF8E583